MSHYLYNCLNLFQQPFLLQPAPSVEGKKFPWNREAFGIFLQLVPEQPNSHIVVAVSECSVCLESNNHTYLDDNLPNVTFGHSTYGHDSLFEL